MRRGGVHKINKKSADSMSNIILNNDITRDVKKNTVVSDENLTKYFEDECQKKIP